MRRDKNYHIRGLGNSYISKVLYFLQYDSNKAVNPLIFDSFAMYFHCAIMIDNNVPDMIQMYSLDGKGKLTTRGDLDNIYKDYIIRMHDVANKYGIKKAGKLEEALFGWPTRGINGCNNNNPRFVAKEYVKKHWPSD